VKLAPGLQLDYVWIKPGTSLKGKRLQIAPWTYGALLDPKTDARDQISSGYFTERMPRVIEQYFRSLWGGGVEVGAEPGDYKLVGRVVDTSIQSMGGRFWMGMMAAQSFTWDLKILDAEGKVVVAAHHRWGVPGGQDPFRSMGEDRIFADLRPFAGALAPLGPKAPEWPKAFELSHSIAPAMASGEAVTAAIHYGSAAPLALRGKSVQVLPWRLSEDEFSPKDPEYGVCAEQTAAMLTQALAPVAPASGAAPDFTLKGILRVKKDAVLYQAVLADASGKEVFRMEQTRETDRVKHLEGRDPEFVQALLTQLSARDGGLQLPAVAPNPPSLLPKEATSLASQDKGAWMAPGLNLSQAHIELAPWTYPAYLAGTKPAVWIHAGSATRALPGLLAAAFVQASRGNTNGLGTIVTEGATHRLEGQVLNVGKKDLGILEARLVEIATGRTVWAMKLTLDEASGRDDQAHDTMEQFVDDEVLRYFPGSLYAAPKAH
ncbi:MAG TPA: hypothetical protein VFM84_03265, partial [Holophagaceae bacterium]|nr:hypothetical protein [Holophagaceae bacterium]